MATVDVRNNVANDSPKSGWNLFSPEMQKQLIDEDLSAGFSVPMILGGVLLAGMLGMLLVVLLTI